MKSNKTAKVLAVFLALLMLFPTTVVQAQDSATDTTEQEKTMMEEVIELLDAENYYDYYAEMLKAGWVDATNDGVTLDLFNFSFKPKSNAAEGDLGAEQRTEKDNDGKEISALYTPEGGRTTWNFTIPETGLYTMVIVYKPVEPADGVDTNTAVMKRELYIDGKAPFKEAYYLEFTRKFVDNYADITREDGKQGFALDKDGNEKKPTKTQIYEWNDYTLTDSTGYIMDPLKIALTQGEHTMTLESTMNEMLISSISLVKAQTNITYDEYLKNTASANVPLDTDTIKIEAETSSSTSDKTIYAENDRTSPINSPQDAANIKLNTIGSAKWEQVGQWIEWTIPGDEIKTTGYYYICPRFKQATLAGLYVSRRLYINGEVPFEEANYLQFNYSDDWQCEPFNNGTENFKFYLEAGKDYTFRLEVVYGSMSDILRRCESVLTNMNSIYNSILKITGPSPDEYADYGFASRIYDTILLMRAQKKEIDDVVQQFKRIIFADDYAKNPDAEITKSATDIATLEKVAAILEKMTSSEDQIAKNLDNLKVNSGTLGTWIMNTKLQPLTLDCFYLISPETTEKNYPDGPANFWQGLWFEVRAFAASFYTDYNSLGSNMDVAQMQDPVEVWIATSRDEAQVIRELIDNASLGFPVNLKLVAGGTLLPATLAGDGPDLSLACGQSEVINYAIRNAVQAWTDIKYGIGDNAVDVVTDSESEYYDFCANNFSSEAIVGLKLENADNPGTFNYFGVPERMGFSMLFYRKDVFAQLEIDIPQTWDELYEIIPVLQVNYRKVGFPSSLGGLMMLLYQRDTDIYSDVDGDGVLDGMRINISVKDTSGNTIPSSNTAIECFQDLCDLFTVYKFPRVYDLATYFRMGEMPIAIADYLTYNQFSIYATEIKGLWGFTTLPGTVQKDSDGNPILDADGKVVVNNNSVCSVSAVILLKDNANAKARWKADQRDGTNRYVTHKNNCWAFTKWWTGSEAQSEYARQYEALIGMAAKINTANTQALKNMPWTAEESTALEAQFENLKGTPEFPGGYIISRYIDFAFLNCYNNNADPTESLLDQIQYINAELTRKRKEFGLITYEEYIEQNSTEKTE